MGLWVPPAGLLAPDLIEPGRKPISPVVLDRDNPITRGMVFCAAYNENGEPVDLVEGAKFTLSAGIKIGQGEFSPQRALKGFNGAIGSASAETKKADYAGFTGPMTGFSYHGLRTGQDGNNLTIIGCADDPGFAMGHEQWNSRRLILSRKWASVSFTGPTFGAGDVVKVSMKHPGTNWNTGAATAVINGTKYTASAADSNAFTSTNPTIKVGNYITDNREFDGEFYLQAIWTRELTDAEMFSLDADPWQLIKPVGEYWRVK